jgi:hypothetical protein
MVIRSVGIVSVVKVSVVLYAGMRLVIGAFLSAMSIFGVLHSPSSWRSQDSVSLLFGFGAVILFPVVYGLLGALASAVGAALYNAVAHHMGGISIDLVVEPSVIPPTAVTQNPV